MKSWYLLALAAVALASCDRPTAPPERTPPPAELLPRVEPALAPLVGRIMMQGVTALDPVSSCNMLGVRNCGDGEVRSLRVVRGAETKFAQVYLRSPGDLSLGYAQGRDVFIFLTNKSGTLLRGMHLQHQGPSRILNASEARPIFEQQLDFWTLWLLDPADAQAPGP